LTIAAFGSVELALVWVVEPIGGPHPAARSAASAANAPDTLFTITPFVGEALRI
jgi:hypothetical protein